MMKDGYLCMMAFLWSLALVAVVTCAGGAVEVVFKFNLCAG